ncbi:MAG: hypothetical protein JW874_11075 [Spirochaetales bacterium]|nr:hypothetical protein [Spirochaetales bacterium]
MNRIVLFVLLALGISTVFAQTDYEKWKAQQDKNFQDFRENEDKRFAEFLEDEWKRFQVFRGVVFDETPKLNEAPVFNTLTTADTGSDSQNEYVLAPVSKDAQAETGTSGYEASDADSIMFFGRNIGFRKPDTPRFSGRINNNTIASFWRKLSAAGFGELAAWLAACAGDMQLDGWGTGVLAAELVQELYPESLVSRRLACWYLLVKNGYDVRVGYNGSAVYLLVPSRNMLFDTPFFTIQGKNYYMHDFAGKPGSYDALYIYENSFNDSMLPVNIEPQHQPKLGKSIYERMYTFTFRGRLYSGSFQFNRALVDYYQTIPHTDSGVYFHIALSDELLESVKAEFSSVLDTLNEQDKVQFMLTFVQTAFDYKTDQQQFGYEKWMLPEEAMFYRYIDCEDRSILFTALVRQVLGLRVIGLDWPGHIAAAVHFSGSVAGTYVPYSGNRFIICDPTYINADIGMVMPSFAGKAVKIIPSE